MVEGLPEDQKGWTCIGCKKSFMFGEKNPIAGASLAATKHMAICEALNTTYPSIKTLKQHRAEARNRHPEWFQRVQRPLRSKINTKLEGHQMEIKKIGTETKKIQRRKVDEVEEPTATVEKGIHVIHCIRCRRTIQQIRWQKDQQREKEPEDQATCTEYTKPRMEGPLRLQDKKNKETKITYRPTTRLWKQTDQQGGSEATEQLAETMNMSREER